jgi:multiple sugar transport system permease protein
MQMRSHCAAGMPHIGNDLPGFDLLALILSLLNAFKVFREAYLVAGRYPQQSIYLLQHLFNNWFLSLDLPRLAAAAILVALVLLAGILALLKWWDHCAKEE